ncbi:glycerol-3-phosphate dehydrogenase/oxidase [Leucobacter sp. OH1287]|uniref:glycerol-3-phosphate dehydrogenase/oxidase n=1 Tax=Leucobacter sp. OH1287 TaxID=2491049 RepID=UPI000F5E3F1A|nr:glycerol-3-phosphate dehydrogenase/oxidase [Leucobacter sp. OH1287]RRD61854.1 glycerol-3-phosphate dehydrogenase/oxidase [Leucobacter sp. OH1287]
MADSLKSRPSADVLIIGGGINGLATFRDLALQGVDVALVERGDYVSGASSASSHMVHGGIRYLENGEFRLVKEAVVERNRLLKNAPHYVKPLRTTIPIFSTFSGILAAPWRLLVTHGSGKPKERGAVLIKTGLVIYDTFSRDGGQVPRHSFVAKKRSLQRFPQLRKDVKYTATYFDASMHDPERIALDVLADGLQAGGDKARAANYVEAVGTAGDKVTLLDKRTGDKFDFTAKVILNVSGSWTDLTNDALGKNTRFMGGTKGSHIVLDNQELLAATGGNEIFFEHSDGRIVLIYPLKDRVLVGTTDSYADPSKPTVCTDDEIDYFFDLVRHVFPKIKLDRNQIVYTFSGIRPLPRIDDTAPGFVSRDYRIERDSLGKTPVLSLVGGKWTTFRALAENLADDALKELGKQRTVSTENLAIGGGRHYPVSKTDKEQWIAENRGPLSADRTSQLLERYGTRAAEVIRSLTDGEQLLSAAPGYSAEELRHLASTEQVVHLDDVLLRRTAIAFVGGMTAETLKQVAQAIADPLGWDADRVTSEINRATQLLHDSHRVLLGSPGVADIGNPEQ